MMLNIKSYRQENECKITKLKVHTMQYYDTKVRNNTQLEVLLEENN